MSQIQMMNTENSSGKSKRHYRKGNPLTASERQQMSVSRKRNTHRAVNVFVPSERKQQFVQLCEIKGVTQSEMIERWIQEELKKLNKKHQIAIKSQS